MRVLYPNVRIEKPCSVYGYFDKLQVWLQNPVSNFELGKLQAHCGKGGLYAETKTSRFSRKVRQRIELRQPDQEALRWLGERNDAFINRIEIALDLAFNTPADRDDTWEFLQRHLVRRWHGREQVIRLVGDEANCTRYDASRKSPNLLVGYCEPYSRATGELYAIHLEWRSNGVRAVRSAGVVEPADVVGFHFRQFWRRRLLLVDVPEKQRLGRLVRNAGRKAKDRKPFFHRNGRNLDWCLGHVLSDGHTTLQELIDYTRWAGVGRLLQIIDNRPFLPPAAAHSLCNYPVNTFLDTQPLD